MKRIIILLVVLATWMSMGIGNALGAGIDLLASVDPNYQDSWDPDTASGKALYTFYIDPASRYGANVFEVTFEDDIFKTVGTAQNGTAGMSAPTTWTLEDDENPGFYEYRIAWGDQDLLAPGETPYVSFWVDYVLLSTDRYYSASGQDWSWNEGDSWGQAVSATNTLVSSRYGNPSGGTSTYPNPEPATMLLLGSGLIGLGTLGRKRLKR